MSIIVLANSTPIYEPKCGGVTGSQPISTAVHRSSNKLRKAVAELMA
jgi:hypothetical protein